MDELRRREKRHVDPDQFAQGEGRFEVGDEVRWESSGREKQGTIVHVVPAGYRPCYYREPAKTRRALDRLGVDHTKFVLSKLGGGGQRGQESYLVAVEPDSDHPQAKPRLYWPKVDWLEEVESG